jgi:TRAP transporter TAXI family solute receptor
MKKILSAVIAAAMVLSLAACGSSGSTTATTAAAAAPAAEAPASLGKMTMGTGGTAGTYYAFGGVLGQYMKNKGGVDVTVVSTDGSKANIQGIDAGDYQLGTVQSDVMAYAWEGSKSFESDGAIDSFRVIGGLYAETVQLVTMDPNIKSVADLAGKAVSIGAPGSGVYFNAIDVLTAAGLSEDTIKPQYLSFADSAEGLKDGKIDAAFIVAGAPTPAITELTTTNDAYLVPIDGEIGEKVLASCPYYTALAIPAGTYKGQEEDVTTVTVKATMIISADATEDQAYAVTAAIFDNIDDITAEHAKGAELSIENATSGMTAPFHAGAAKYFKEKGVDVETK